METQTETINKKEAEEKQPIEPLFQRENTTKIDELLAWWKEQPNHHINMRTVTPPANYPNMDKEPILMYHNKPVAWIEYRAGCWYGFSHYIGGFKTKDHKFPRVHNKEEENDFKKNYLEVRKRDILAQVEKDKQTTKLQKKNKNTQINKKIDDKTA